MYPLSPRQVNLDDPYWSPRLEVNVQRAIFHQWEKIEASGCINNFRLAAREIEGFREGWFFADSDAYKWLDTAPRSRLRSQFGQLNQPRFVQTVGVRFRTTGAIAPTVAIFWLGNQKANRPKLNKGKPSSNLPSC